MLEGLPVMLALCFMLWHAYYAKNYAGIIDAGLLVAYLPLMHFSYYFDCYDAYIIIITVYKEVL